MNKAIILDLDETLIHSVVLPIPDFYLAQICDFSFQFGEFFYVFKRPGLDQFLQTVFTYYKYVGIWTAAEPNYAKEIIRNIITSNQLQRLVFVFTRRDCELAYSKYYYKPLYTVWNEFPLQFNKFNTMILDDMPLTIKANVPNGILAPAFTPNNLKQDEYLWNLIKLINTSLQSSNTFNFVRRANKLNTLYYGSNIFN